MMSRPAFSLVLPFACFVLAAILLAECEMEPVEGTGGGDPGFASTSEYALRFGPGGTMASEGGELFAIDGLAAADVGEEFQVNTYTTGAQRWTSAGMGSDGRFVVAWMSQGDISERGTGLLSPDRGSTNS